MRAGFSHQKLWLSKLFLYFAIFFSFDFSRTCIIHCAATSFVVVKTIHGFVSFLRIWISPIVSPLRSEEKNHNHDCVEIVWRQVKVMHRNTKVPKRLFIWQRCKSQINYLKCANARAHWRSYNKFMLWHFEFELMLAFVWHYVEVTIPSILRLKQWQNELSKWTQFKVYRSIWHTYNWISQQKKINKVIVFQVERINRLVFTNVWKHAI